VRCQRSGAVVRRVAGRVVAATGRVVAATGCRVGCVVGCRWVVAAVARIELAVVLLLVRA